MLRGWVSLVVLGVKGLGFPQKPKSRLKALDFEPQVLLCEPNPKP